MGIEGSWATIVMHNLPSEGPFMWVGTASGDQENPRLISNDELTHKGSADEAVVVIKGFADEGMVTCLRVKQILSYKDVEAKGGT